VSSQKKLEPLRPMSEINLTPLMDLTFILLIAFIITFPLIEHGIDIRVPRATAQDLTPEDARTIGMDAQGRLYWNEQVVTFEELAALVAETARLAPQAAVLVRADETLSYGAVVKILKLLYEAKITNTALVTRAETS
jgi:biopolymer transport protein TolR